MGDHVFAMGGLETTGDLGEEIEAVHRNLYGRILGQMLNGLAK